jgi:hypothetical protein
VSPEKTKSMLMSLSQKLRQMPSMKISNRTYEVVAKLKYLENTPAEQRCTHEEIKNRVNLGNACYYSVESLLSSRLLSM